MHLAVATHNALYALVNACTAPPRGGTQSTTVAALAAHAERSGRLSRLALSILAEIPPHADKDPESLAELLRVVDEEIRR